MLEIHDNMLSKMPRYLLLSKNSTCVNPAEQRGLTEDYLWSSPERSSSLSRALANTSKRKSLHLGRIPLQILKSIHNI
jgi:hypothetical protein